MIRLAKRVAHAAFGVGIAIGIMLAPGLQPAATASMMCSPAPLPDSSCVDVSGQPQEVVNWVNLQCQVHQAIFGDGSEPGVVFSFGKDVNQPGSYPGKSWDGRDVKLEVVTAVDMDLKSNAPDLFNQGVTAHMVIGRLWGPAGSIPFSGTVMYPKGVTTDTKYLLIVASVLSANDFDLFARAGRIQAGVRVLDVGTYKAYALADVTRMGASSCAPEDPSTIYAQNVNQAAGSPDNSDCVKRALEDYRSKMDLAYKILALCAAGALAVYVTFMLGCLALSLEATPLASMVCAAITTAAYCFALAGCLLVFAVSAQAAEADYIRDMGRCGVNILIM